MKSISLHHSFKPSKCGLAESHQAATVGAGAQGGEILDFLAKHNLTTVVGSSQVQILSQNITMSQFH